MKTKEVIKHFSVLKWWSLSQCTRHLDLNKQCYRMVYVSSFNKHIHTCSLFWKKLENLMSLPIETVFRHGKNFFCCSLCPDSFEHRHFIDMARLVASSPTYLLEVCLPPFNPANTVKGHVGASVFPCDSERGLGHLREPQVLGRRNNICKHGPKWDRGCLSDDATACEESLFYIIT